jgi:hypothetical protein
VGFFCRKNVKSKWPECNSNISINQEEAHLLAGAFRSGRRWSSGVGTSELSSCWSRSVLPTVVAHDADPSGQTNKQSQEIEWDRWDEESCPVGIDLLSGHVVVQVAARTGFARLDLRRHVLASVLSYTLYPLLFRLFDESACSVIDRLIVYSAVFCEIK